MPEAFWPSAQSATGYAVQVNAPIINNVQQRLDQETQRVAEHPPKESTETHDE